MEKKALFLNVSFHIPFTEYEKMKKNAIEKIAETIQDLDIINPHLHHEVMPLNESVQPKKVHLQFDIHFG
jgi:hypothetical protein